MKYKISDNLFGIFCAILAFAMATAYYDADFSYDDQDVSNSSDAPATTTLASSPANAMTSREKLINLYQDAVVRAIPKKKTVDLRKIKLHKMIRASRNVDLCFLVDVTGSMGMYIESVRTSINSIVDKLTQANNADMAIARNLRLAFVGYRDIGDDGLDSAYGDSDDPESRIHLFEILDFTTDAKKFEDFCSKVVADGGNDFPEDVMGGMEKTCDLSWSHKFGTKVIFHIADAPCHGKKFFHGLGFSADGESSEVMAGYNDDRYPEGDPQGRTPETFFEKVFPKKGIQYHFGKINSATDKMIKEFRKMSESPIKEFDIKDVQAMTDKVVNMVSASIDHVVKKARTQYKHNSLEVSNSGGNVSDSGTDVNEDSEPDVSKNEPEDNTSDIDNTKEVSDSEE